VLDLDRLRRIHPRQPPVGQWLIANLGLSWDYRLPRRTHIEVEGLENLPRDRRVFLAMNHTDRYNYWPLQYALYRRGHGFTATWVKGKYYENNLLGWFMDQTTNIPLPSRGYVLTTEFRKAMGRAPSDDEYRALRDAADGVRGAEGAAIPEAVAAFFAKQGGAAAFARSFAALFDEMSAEVVRITREALENEYHVLVFPQGTRSKRLSRGHTGLVQAAMALGVDIVPIGCNGSDRAYPGSSPFSKGGRVTYRVGEILRIDGPELGPHRVHERFDALTDTASAAHDAKFRAATDIVMARIDALLDEEYRFGAKQASDGVQGVRRFV
jgi:1-acyl-sn-glycerol-3-phosphate acyltransferase